MHDNNFTELAGETTVLAEVEYTNSSTAVLAPDNTTTGAITLYTEGVTFADSCIVLADGLITPTPPPVIPPVSDGQNILANGGFEQGKASWLDCAAEGLTTPSSDSNSGLGSLQITNAGCLYQEFVVTSGKDYRLRCDAKSIGAGYSSVGFQFSDASYSRLASDEFPVGRGEFQNINTQMRVPDNGSIGVVTLYSEDTSIFDSCSVEEL